MGLAMIGRGDRRLTTVLYVTIIVSQGDGIGSRATGFVVVRARDGVSRA
jgi:hypothetical protein